VIDTLHNLIDEDNVAVACVYCDVHAHEEQAVASVLAALLKQLVALETTCRVGRADLENNNGSL